MFHTDINLFKYKVTYCTFSSLFHFKSNVLEHRARNCVTVQLRTKCTVSSLEHTQ